MRIYNSNDIRDNANNQQYVIIIMTMLMDLGMLSTSTFVFLNTVVTLIYHQPKLSNKAIICS